MYFVLIVTLLCCGASASWAAVNNPAKAAKFERAGGALLIAGFILLGIALPAAHHLLHG
jgi:hypothetical protein